MNGSNNSGFSAGSSPQELFNQIEKMSGFRMERLESEAVDLIVRFPIQPGLRFQVTLYLQNLDEAYLEVAGFRTSWFPLGKNEGVEKEFVSSVVHLLKGDARVVEWYRGSQYQCGELQMPLVSGWRTVKSNVAILIPKFWRRQTQRIIQNKS